MQVSSSEPENQLNQIKHTCIESSIIDIVII